MPKTFLKQWKYRAGDFFANILLTLTITLFRRLTPQSTVVVSKVMGRIASSLSKKYKDRALSNLSVAFGGEKDDEEIQRIIKDVFYHLAMTGFETIYGMAHPWESLQAIKIEGKEHLDAALSHGNGVIAVGAHLGSFTLLGPRLGMEGYRVNIIIDMAKFPKVWNRINQREREFGETPFPSTPVSSSIRKSLNCLRRNEVLYIIADQQQRRGGIAVPFFGRMAYTPPGPAIFSLKTGAPVLPMFVLRESGLGRTLVIGKPIDMERTFDERKDIETLTAKLTNVIEDTVRHYPGQWAWLNRRWKMSRHERFGKTHKEGLNENLSQTP